MNASQIIVSLVTYKPQNSPFTIFVLNVIRLQGNIVCICAHASRSIPRDLRCVFAVVP